MSSLNKINENQDPFKKSSRVSRSPTSGSAQTFLSENKSQASANGNEKKDQAYSEALVNNDAQKLQSIVQENLELRVRLQKMELLCAELKKELDELKSKSETNPDPQLDRPDNISYHTDEEEVVRETDWILKKRPGKKRKATSSPEFIVKDKSLELKPVDLKITTTESKHVKQAPKVRPPPPINVFGIKDYNKLHDLLKSVSSADFRVKFRNNDTWTVNVSNADTYRSVSQKLNSEQIQWHTYENKTERPIRVIARGLHASCSKQKIIDELNSKGFKILEAVNILSQKKDRTKGEEKIVKRGLPLFRLSFDKTESVKKIYEIKKILDLDVVIQPLRKNSRIIPQCTRCQGFNHTQAYCQKEPRCVKCAGKHLSRECSVTKSSPALCINCRGKHPANYRGCEVAKELQKRRDQSKSIPLKDPGKTNAPKSGRGLTQSIPPKPLKRTNVATKKTTLVQSGKTYAQVAAPANEARNNSPDPVSMALLAILAKLEEQTKLNKIIVEKLLNSGNRSRKQ